MKPDDLDRSFWLDHEKRPADRSELAQRIADYNATRESELRLRRLVTIAVWIVVTLFVIGTLYVASINA